MKRTALIASLAASLALAACGGSEPAEEQTEEEPGETSETDAEITPETPKTDGEGNEIVSEGPGQPYSSNDRAAGPDGNTPPVRSDGRSPAPVNNASDGARPAAQSGSATPAGARPSPGSKLQKADPQ